MSEKRPTKPLTMLINETKEKIEGAIATSGLPSCIIEQILMNYWLQVKSAAEDQGRAEKAKYEKETEEIQK